MSSLFEQPARTILVHADPTDAGALEEALCRPVPARREGDAGDAGFVVERAVDHADAIARFADTGDAGLPIELVVVKLAPGVGPSSVEAISAICAADASVRVLVCASEVEFDWVDASVRIEAEGRVLLLKGEAEPDELWQAASALVLRRRADERAVLEAADLDRRAKSAEAALDEQIRRRSEVEEELRHLAYHDPVTGLPNRTYLFDHIERCIERANRHPEFNYAVLYIDLDNFKLINDTMGHDRGDRLLQDVAQRLRACMRTLDSIAQVEEDVAARVGGDEFIVLLEGIREASDSVRVAERFLEALKRPFRIDGKELIVCASIGIATSDRRYRTSQEVMRDADTAMYRAKSLGKGRFALFDPEMHAEARRRLEVESRLRECVASERMHLMYQPIVEVRTQELIGFEALFRCPLPGLDASPQEIINVAEETGLIIPIGRWVFRRACEDLRRWRETHASAAALRININTSRRELADERLIEGAREAMAMNNIPADRVAVEVTESGIMRDSDAALAQLQRFRDLGVSLHMDDFGTGYSSLACLHAYPLSGVKIDRAFTATMTNDQRYIAVVKAIVTLCQTLDMCVTVEGIETPEQLELVDSLGCDAAQGYMFAKPMSIDQVDDLLARGTVLRLAA